MNRLFGVGGSSSTSNGGGLTEATEKLDNRVAAIDGKLKVLEEQLGQVQKQLTMTRPGGISRDALRSQARSLLTQRRTLQAQRQQLQAQSLNLFQIDLAATNVRDAQDTLKAMQGVKRELARTLGKVRPEMVEVLGEEVSELVADSWEVQELLGRSYETLGVGEDELEEELRMLEGAVSVEEENVWDRVLPPKVDLPSIPSSNNNAIYPDLDKNDFYQNKN